MEAVENQGLSRDGLLLVQRKHFLSPESVHFLSYHINIPVYPLCFGLR